MKKNRSYVITKNVKEVNIYMSKFSNVQILMAPLISTKLRKFATEEDFQLLEK